MPAITERGIHRGCIRPAVRRSFVMTNHYPERTVPFEIRAICDPVDTDRVTTALSRAFATGALRQYPTRDGERTRLYVTADHDGRVRARRARHPA